MRERWFSRRAVALHAAALVVVTGCALATWWQVTRAADGNQLSYFYSGMWPAFGLLTLYFWWSLIHTDFETTGRRGLRRQTALGGSGADGGNGTVGPSLQQPVTAPPVDPDEDPELAAYNDRLAALAAQGPKTWRRSETVVVRRPQ